MKQQHTVTNKGDSEIKVHMEDGWHTVPPGEQVTGVLLTVNGTGPFPSPIWRCRSVIFGYGEFGSNDACSAATNP